MQKSSDMLARAYALELLSALNDQPHINKENLFAAAAAYYRWLLADPKALESLEIYWREFEAHHKALVAGAESAVRVGCFITWFVEQQFHTLPPLTINPTHDEQQLQFIQHARFSQPSFRLPTGDPVESYLVQWLYWHLDNLPKDGEQPDRRSLYRWASEMLDGLDEQPNLTADEFTVLFRHAARFFAWCLSDLRSWDTFMDLFVLFLRSEEGQAIDQTNVPLADVRFVQWFSHRTDEHDLQDQSEPASTQDREA